jgi:N-acetylneuraminate lyase
MVWFQGIWPALVTPLATEDSVSEIATESLVASLLQCGVGGIYVAGGTGEGVILPAHVRRQVAEVVVDTVAGRVPVMVHVGALNSEEGLGLARHAQQIGADAVSAVPPFYYSYDLSSIQDHYRRIIDAAQLPLYIYHIPATTGTSLEPDQLLDLCQVPGIRGFKYTSHDLAYLSSLLARRDQGTNILSGPDELLLPCLALGVDGAIGTTYNLMPRLYLDLAHAVQVGNLPLARQLQFQANAIIDALRPFGVIPATKATLDSLGFAVGQASRPLQQLDASRRAELGVALHKAGWTVLLERPRVYDADDPMRGQLA